MYAEIYYSSMQASKQTDLNTESKADFLFKDK